jgi:hypothetical protein
VTAPLNLDAFLERAAGSAHRCSETGTYLPTAHQVLTEDVPALVAEIKRLRDAEQLVRDIHTAEQYPDELLPWCTSCNEGNERGDWVIWPCPTLRALDGVPARTGDES